MASTVETAATKTYTFDIKVALIGSVSVGKSTVLNALLGDKFSEVAVKRTTAGVNFFRVIQPTENDGADPEEGWSTIVDAVHEEIAKDNEELRLTENVEEKTFDIRVRRPICKMRKDTHLVLIDIPGINEAESSKKYKDYVESNWKTFDCVVVVMDAIQGVNTQEQVDLLQFVRGNNQNLKDVPTIVLVNKMDDLDDEDTIHQIEETRSKTVEIFGSVDYRSVQRNTKGADAALSSDMDGGLNKTAFVPMSAKNAYVYMKARYMDLDMLGDPEHLDLAKMIGHDKFGRKLSEMNREDKIYAVTKILQDKTELDERLASSNFMSFISSLSDFVGRDACKKGFDELMFETIYRSTSLGNTDAIGFQGAFWRAYSDCEDRAMEGLAAEVDPSIMKRPFLELEKYHELTSTLQWTEESVRTMEAMKQLLRRQLCFLKEKVVAWTFTSYCESCGALDFCNWNKEWEWNVPKNVTWDNLSPHEWMVILDSLSLIWNQSCFVESFGPEKVALNGSLRNFQGTFASAFGLNPIIFSLDTHDRCTQFCIRRFRLAKKEVRLEMPNSLVDPSHWGFLAWKYIKFCGRDKRIGAKSNSSSLALARAILRH